MSGEIGGDKSGLLRSEEFSRRMTEGQKRVTDFFAIVGLIGVASILAFGPEKVAQIIKDTFNP